MVSARDNGARNRPRTEEEILKALEDQIREEGILRTGINNVAKRANVSKELIYRYFGGMDGLILAMMNGQDYWTRPGDITTAGREQDEPAASAILAMLLGQVETLRGNEIVQEVRRWELIEADETRQKLAKRREAAARGFRVAARHDDESVDVPAVTGILLAGVLYLVLRAKTEDHFLGVPLNDDAGWRRFEAALELLVGRTFLEETKIAKDE